MGRVHLRVRDRRAAMWRQLVILALVGACAARPLQWFAEEEDAAVDMHKDVPKDLAFAMERSGSMYPPHMHGAVEPTSFLQTTTGGHPLECDCERVKCNCVKRCECQLPAAQQNRQASAFLEIIGGKVGETTPLYVDVDTNECFLETGGSVGQDQHHMLDCECDKVKCNCVKHCECSLPATAAGAQVEAIQTAEGSGDSKQAATETLLEESEGLGAGVERAHKKEGDDDDEDVVAEAAPADNDGATTESFMKEAGLPDGPAQDAAAKKQQPSVSRSRTVKAAKVSSSNKDASVATDKDGGYKYDDYKYDEEAYGDDEKSSTYDDYKYDYDQDEKSGYEGAYADDEAYYSQHD